MTVTDVRISRRGFVGGSIAAAGLASAAGLLPGAFGWAASKAYTGDTLVVLNQTGGADWLSLVAPVADLNYRSARPSTAIPLNSPRLDGTFALHPNFAPLQALYNAGQLAFVHAVGNPDPTRSHFDAIRLQATAGVSSSGWVERFVAATAKSGVTGNSLASMHLGNANAPLMQFGPVETTSMTSTSAYTLIPPAEGYSAAAKTLAKMYAGLATPTAQAARDVLSTLDPIAAVSKIAPAAAYPNTHTGKALADVARLIRANVGLQVATVEIPSWDMHTDLGVGSGGQLATRADEMAQAIAAFHADLGSLLAKVTLVTITEFGRRVAQNGNAGLDHGHGFAMAVFGGSVNGGKVYGSWPGLAASQLDNGDLRATTDYRQVLGEILQVRCGVTPSSVFPGAPGGFLGVVRS